MTDDQKRKLTEEVLGECWWMPLGSGEIVTVNGVYVRPRNNRTFTAAQDMMDLKEKLARGTIQMDWIAFIYYAMNEFTNDGGITYGVVPGLIDWLINPTRFCQLVADWWEERRNKG